MIRRSALGVMLRWLPLHLMHIQISTRPFHLLFLPQTKQRNGNVWQNGFRILSKTTLIIHLARKSLGRFMHLQVMEMQHSVGDMHDYPPWSSVRSWQGAVRSIGLESIYITRSDAWNVWSKTCNEKYTSILIFLHQNINNYLNRICDPSTKQNRSHVLRDQYPSWNYYSPSFPSARDVNQEGAYTVRCTW